VANADRTVHQGVEAGVGAAMLKSAFTSGDSVWLNAAYTLNDFRFDNDRSYRNNRLPGPPRHYLRAELLYRHPSGFYAGPNTEWVPQAYYADSANTQTVDRYTLWNFRIGYDPQKAGWSGYIEARNLLDARYIASTAVAQTADATSALSEPGSGRAIYGGVRLTW
jgi:iron complex outermembrane receptor protein